MWIPDLLTMSYLVHICVNRHLFYVQCAVCSERHLVNVHIEEGQNPAHPGIERSSVY